MNKIIANQIKPINYFCPGGLHLFRLVIEMVGGKSVSVSNGLAYWINYSYIQPLVKIDPHGICATTQNYKINHQQTFLELPALTVGIAINPNGNTLNVYAEIN
jgi:hypothetical protein